MNDVVITDIRRTPVGRYAGVLSGVRVDDLAAAVIRAMVEELPASPEAIDDVAFGCVNTSGEAMGNLGRYAGLIAGLPVEVPGFTINRFCASSLTAFNTRTHALAYGSGQIALAGGAESMSRSTWIMPKPTRGFPLGNPRIRDSMMSGAGGPTHPKLETKGWMIDMPETARNLMDQYGIEREEADRFALRSHQRAHRATEQGDFQDEILPVEGDDGNGEKTTVIRDETIRSDTSLEALSSLPDAFEGLPDITAGNSCPLADGASGAVLMTDQRARELGVQPLARVVSTAAVGVDPTIMGIAPARAIPEALKRANLSLDDVDVFEINEAFAAQVLAVQQELSIPDEKLNVRGGAIALGHALGNSGTRILCTLVHALRASEGTYGVASLCVGGGQGVATVIKRVD